MKKLALMIEFIALFVLFAASASAAVLGGDKELRSGIKYYNTRNYNKAVAHLQKYLDNKPDPKAYYLIGYSMYKMGRLSEAGENFSEAYLIDPEFSPEKISLAKLSPEEITPIEPLAAEVPEKTPGAEIIQAEAVLNGSQSAKPLPEVFEEQKAGNVKPPEESASIRNSEIFTQQLAMAPYFMECSPLPEVGSTVDEKPAEETVESPDEAPVEEFEKENNEITTGNGISDPLEPWNRAMFTFNDRFYFWVVKPLARGYSVIVPQWGRVRVKNVFHNITMPVRFVNNLLQLKIRRAGTELLRFVFNTTAGAGGMFDVAKNIDLKSPDEDLGQTLGVYGIGNGFYIIWPVLGFSSLRDSVGTVGDFFLDPVSYIQDFELFLEVRSFDYTNEASLHIGDYEDMKESALDPYISFRNAYFEYRKHRVKE